MSESDYRKATFDQCIASFPEDARGLRYLTWDGVRLMAPERRKSLAYCHPIPSAECRLLVLFKELNEPPSPEPDTGSGHITAGVMTPDPAQSTHTEDWNSIRYYLHMLKHAVKKTHMIETDEEARMFCFILKGHHRAPGGLWLPANNVYTVRDMYVNMRILGDDVLRFLVHHADDQLPHPDEVKCLPGSTPPNGKFAERGP